MPTRNKNKNVLNKENITCSPNKEDGYGLGFMVNGKWKNNIHKQWKENDWHIAIKSSIHERTKKYTNPIYKKEKLAKGLRMELKIKNSHKLIIMINCEALHSELTKKKPEDTEIFYENLDKLVNK